MNAVELIIRKREGQALDAEEIRWLIREYVRVRVPDYQMSAWLMAAFLRGLNSDELVALTDAMMHSGEVFDWSAIPGPKSDKHSTGGVGDKVSLILAPLAAACGLVVPMVAGRGLGHTGGTLDKLNSIPGFSVNPDRRRIATLLRRSGVVIAGQTADFVPADWRMYALRDVTGTVESIPLIAASIMSKKLAEGCESLVLDVKVGNGAFMTDRRRARELARTMIDIGTRMGRRVTALLTDMNQPTGRAVGNANEMREAIDCLHGKWPDDLRTVTLALTAEMLMMGGLAKTRDEADVLMQRALDSGTALEKLREIIENQGGDPRVVDRPSLLSLARKRDVIVAPRTGWLTAFDTRGIGLAAGVLGAGRQHKEDAIDYGVGLWLEAKIGDFVETGQPIFLVAHRGGRRWEEARRRLAQCFTIGNDKPRSPRTILERIGDSPRS